MRERFQVSYPVEFLDSFRRVLACECCLTETEANNSQIEAYARLHGTIAMEALAEQHDGCKLCKGGRV